MAVFHGTEYAPTSYRAITRKPQFDVGGYEAWGATISLTQDESYDIWGATQRWEDGVETFTTIPGTVNFVTHDGSPDVLLTF
jgi:hypothetical protein